MSSRVLLLAFALLGLVACGGGAVSPTALPVPPAPPSPSVVAGESVPTAPPATLTDAAGQSQQAVVGSYCWPFEGGAIACSNPLVVQAPTVPLTVASGAPLTFALPSEPLTMVTMRVLAWKPVEGASSGDTTLVAPDAPLLASGDLEPSATITWEAPPEPGEYFLDMATVYQNGGTIAYGWHLLVQP